MFKITHLQIDLIGHLWGEMICRDKVASLKIAITDLSCLTVKCNCSHIHGFLVSWIIFQYKIAANRPHITHYPIIGDHHHPFALAHHPHILVHNLTTLPHFRWSTCWQSEPWYLFMGKSFLGWTIPSNFNFQSRCSLNLILNFNWVDIRIYIRYLRAHSTSLSSHRYVPGHLIVSKT